jgi:ABC-type amino acid transport substrate-binding protein
MKKLITMTLVLAMGISLCACGKKGQTNETSGNGSAGDQPHERITGTISMLNMTEDEYADIVESRRKTGVMMIEEGYTKRPDDGPGAPGEELPPEEQEGKGQPQEVNKGKIVFYDSLDALLMALNAGDIDSIEIYQSVARYLCATNDNLRMGISYDTDKELGTFAQLVQTGHNCNDFAFMMLEKNAALRDEFNTAIADMKSDGTLDRLVKEQIDAAIEGAELKTIEMPEFAGAETVKIAVTGAFPPMDYVAANGTPAGFNTAVLAEIGNRIGKNIELVVVDSIGRATALSSGAVDAVFWTRTSMAGKDWGAKSEAEQGKDMAEKDADMTEEEIELLKEVDETIDFLSYGTADMPEGTIITDAYFSDIFVPVELVREEPQGK